MFSLRQTFFGFAAGLLSSVGIATAQEQDLGMEESCPVPIELTRIECGIDGAPPIAVFTACEEIEFTAGVIDVDTGEAIIVAGTMTDYFETVATAQELKQLLRGAKAQEFSVEVISELQIAQQGLSVSAQICPAR